MATQQPSFFELTENTIRVLNVNAVRARKSDPPTSQDAAQMLTRADSHCLRILRVYAAHPGGLTDAEMEAVGVVKHAWKRCSDLRKWGLVAPVRVNGEIALRPGPCNRMQQVCAITTEGWRALGVQGG